ncbi:MAG: S8 family peptidase, partial [Luteolibacter sp.]
MRNRLPLWLLGFALCVMLGYWLAGTARIDPPRPASSAEGGTKQTIRAIDDPPPVFRRHPRGGRAKMDAEALAAGALDGERVIAFKDREAMRRFLDRMGDRVRLLGRLDALNALRVGFSDPADLTELLDGEGEMSMIFPVTTPPLPEGSVQPGAQGLFAGLLEWLGISGDNSAFGKGVKIAVLDTGVASHSAFQTLIRNINLVDMPGDPAALNGHGTAVASMIIGNGNFTPGVAPGAEIISVRVADDLGMSDSFLLAQGIISAVDAGAKLVNISMGSLGQSALLEQAIAYASERGALIFAAAGNNGIDQVYYPAAYDSVIAVGAVDAAGNHLAFSNTGSQIDISAPGYAINAAWPGDQAARVSGTSFSTPIVVGAMAAVMTEAGAGNLTPAQAWQLVSAYLNDAGSAGQDVLYGAGMPDIGRVLAAKTTGIFDAAVASQSYLPPDPGHPYGQVEVLVQNRGTETLVNTAVQVSSGGHAGNFNITTLAPNAVTTVRVPVTRPLADGIEVDARVSISGG